MIEELDIVALEVDRPDLDLQAGERGTVVLAGIPGVLGVEFPALWTGDASPVVELSADELRLVAKHATDAARPVGAPAG